MKCPKCKYKLRVGLDSKNSETGVLWCSVCDYVTCRKTDTELKAEARYNKRRVVFRNSKRFSKLKPKVEEILKLRSESVPVKEISVIMQVSRQAVYDIINDNKECVINT